jgi:hypothetical protein
MKSINIFQTYKEFDDKRGILPTISLNYIEDRNVCVSAKVPNYFYIESKVDNNEITFGADTWFGENNAKISYILLGDVHSSTPISKIYILLYHRFFGYTTMFLQKITAASQNSRRD